MQDLIVGKIFLAEIDGHGNKRVILVHFLCKLETIIANTVLVGSSGFKFGANISPPLYATSTLRVLGRFTTCIAQKTTSSRLFFALNGISCLRHEIFLEIFDF